MEKIRIGKIVGAAALRGEVKIYCYGSPERFAEVEALLLASSADFTRYEIERARVQKNMAIVKLKGVDDRNAAEALRDSEVYITEGDLPPLPEDTYYVRDLNGCRVEDAETGRTIGRVREVIQNTAQDVYVVELADGRETMIPAVAEFVKSVDVAAKLIRVKLIPGFIDEAGVTVED